jgi:hypothetical protein
MPITEHFEVELWEPRPRDSSAALRLSPRADEALMSWLHRYATSFALSPSLLLLDRADIGLLTDLDWWRRPHPQLTARLAARTGVTRPAVEAMTFMDWTPQPWSEQMSAHHLHRRFHGVRPMNERRQWFAVCPECLATDAIAYVRKSWTVGWVRVCTVHSRVLLRQCPKCRQGMAFPHFEADKHFAPQRCGRCGFRFSNAAQRIAHPIAVRLQELLFAHRPSATVPLPLIGALQWPTTMAFFDKLIALVWGNRLWCRLEPLLAHIRAELELAEDLRRGHYEGLLILAWLLDQWPQHLRFAMDSFNGTRYMQRADRLLWRVVTAVTREVDEILLPVWRD